MLILILILFLIFLFFYKKQNTAPIISQSFGEPIINEKNFKDTFYNDIKNFKQFNPIEFENVFKYIDLLNQKINANTPCKLEVQSVKDISNSIIDKYHNLYYSLPSSYHNSYNINFIKLEKYLRNVRDKFINNCRNQGFANITTMSYLLQEKEKPYEKNEIYTMILN